MTRSVVANTDPHVTRVFIVRHGRTEWNAKKILQGHIDIDINSEGKAQAVLVGKYLKDFPLDAALSSDLSRCVNTTAEILAHHPKTPLVCTLLLREREMGKAQGLPLSEALEKYGVNFRNLGESESELIARASAAYDGLLKQAHMVGHRNVLMCTHGGWITTFVNHLHAWRHYALAEGLTKQDLRVPFNTSVTVIDVDRSGQGTIQKFGVTEHLGANLTVQDQLLR